MSVPPSDADRTPGFAPLRAGDATVMRGPTFMRARGVAPVVAAALLAALAGCGDSNDTVIVGGGPTPPPTGAVRTATPQQATTAPTPTVIATATAATTAVEETPTPIGATATATPVPTATPGSAVDADVQRIAADVVPFLANTTILTGGSVSALTAANAPVVRAAATESGAAALKSDPCPQGGTRVDDEGFPARTLTFQACDVSDQLGSFEFDGTVVITLNSFDGGSIAFDFTLTDRAANHAVHFSGTLPLTVASSGFQLDGVLTVSTPEGDFTLHSNKVTISAERKVVSGSGTITDDADNFDVATVAFVVVHGGASANLTVTFDDDSVHGYTLDLATGALTQTS